MSCFRCFSSARNPVDEILERGLRLRNAIVEAILSSDPLYEDSDNSKVRAFLKGDSLSRDEEQTAFETLRSMSATDLCKVLPYGNGTQKSLEFNQEKCDLFKFVDSIRVSVHSFVLNDAGEKQVNAGGVFGGTFFLEYHVPNDLVRKNEKNGLVRMCARRGHSKAISYQQASIHDIYNLSHSNLDNLSMNFFLTYRQFKQKNSTKLGIAKFDFASFRATNTFTCSQELAVTLNGTSPILIGRLKVQLQLGTGRLYFGKEFSAAIESNKENWNINLSPNCDNSGKCDDIEVPSKPVSKSQPALAVKKTTEINDRKTVLFGLISIKQAHFQREVFNSYFRVQLFHSTETISSRVVQFSSKPIYNFSQQIPLIYDDDFLTRLRENYIVVEFFEKTQNREFILGVAKVNLHQFYLTYRNPAIVKYLLERKDPILGSDCQEPIINPYNDEILGNADILVALGTKEQIDNLEQKRRGEEQKISKIDVGIQSDMDAFLNQLISQRETGTNTEPEAELRSSSDLFDTLQKALSIDGPKEKEFFTAKVFINNALHLPNRRKCKARVKNRNTKQEIILPCTYVTFEDYKGVLKRTPIVSKSCAPKWETEFKVNLSIDLLTNNQKYFVVKVWKKSTNGNTPANPQNDHVIGFATVDLTVLAAGLPFIQGWYNINDLTKKANGQINLQITPLEDVLKYRVQNTPTSPIESSPNESGETLNRALKRKFTELDEITQRLRLRLSKVTSEESDTSTDEIADEFEHDINTLWSEEELDKSFSEGEKIDHLLEKMSLFSGEVSSRYISGCSDIETARVSRDVAQFGCLMEEGD